MLSMKYPLFVKLIEQETGCRVQEEYRFHPYRRWRFDIAVPDLMVAVEIEGGIWSGGRHTRGKGYQGDMEKYNAAQMLGWKVLRYTPDQVSVCLQDLKQFSQGEAG
jgi:very-short-patch-repair endonuclease